jgi:hypothetical protein
VQRLAQEAPSANVKLLFADDQIPDENAPANDDELIKKMEELYPRRSDTHARGREQFLKGFISARRTAEKLRSGGHEVNLANSYAKALDLVEREHFDIAIVDLAWFADRALSNPERDAAGWRISAAIAKADTKFGTTTRQIMYSGMFAKELGTSIEAASRGILPIYKSNNEATHEALKAAVKFVETQLSSRAEEIRILLRQSVEEPIRQHRLWFRFTLGCVVASVAVALVGSMGVFFVNVNAQRFQIVLESLPALISGILFGVLFRYQQIIDRAIDRILRMGSTE